jgi:cytochrome c oxidase subunit 2
MITANELHIPAGREVAITLHSVDVIHSFWVPELVGKTDMIPGRTNELHTFTAYEPGIYYGQCAEFCGSAHALMRFRVVVDTTADFNRWVTAHNTPPAAPAPGTAEARGQLQFAACAGCHAISGTTAQGRIGPDLTLFGERHTLAAGILDNTDANLRAWIHDVRSVKPIPNEPRFMPTFAGVLNEGQISDIAAYLRSLRIQ